MSSAAEVCTQLQARLNRAALILQDARVTAAMATRDLIAASEEYQRAAQHLAAELDVAAFGDE